MKQIFSHPHRTSLRALFFAGVVFAGSLFTPLVAQARSLAEPLGSSNVISRICTIDCGPTINYESWGSGIWFCLYSVRHIYTYHHRQLPNPGQPNSWCEETGTSYTLIVGVNVLDKWRHTSEINGAGPVRQETRNGHQTLVPVML